MSNNQIRDARAALVTRRKELADELKNVDQAIAALDNVLGNAIPTTRRTGQTRSRVKPAIVDFLKANHRVVHADEIVHAMNAQGVTLSSKDPKATVVTALIRMRDEGEVEALGGNRYIWSEYADAVREGEAVRATFEDEASGQEEAEQHVESGSAN